jgi:hypothetical protein
MLRFLYWATQENGTQINFIDERLFAEGDTIYYREEKVTIFAEKQYKREVF